MIHRRFRRHIDRGRIARIFSRHRIVDERRILDGARERPDLIEARGEGDESVARNAPVGRLESDDVAERGGFANRTAGIAAKRHRRGEAADGRRAAARRAARHAVAVVGVARNAERGVFARRTHREFIHVGLADRQRARIEQPLHGRPRIRRDPVLEDLRAARRARTAHAHVVLDRDRHARQRQRLTGRDPRIDPRRMLAHQLGRRREVRAKLSVDARNLRDHRLSDLRGGHFF